MLPDDANPAGNVHGGTILKMIEMAGYIAATRHANKLKGSEEQAPLPPAHAHIARIDHMDFLEVRPAVCLATVEGGVGWRGGGGLPCLVLAPQR
jgi:acyl-coenzyme A thioesterase PaaI-like protein